MISPSLLPLPGLEGFDEARGTLVTSVWRQLNRRESSPLSPIAAIPLETLLSGRVSPFLPQKPKHANPPIPLFKISRSEWPQVVRRISQGESLRQIARSYHTSYEAVRRVLSAARKGLLASEGVPSTRPPEDKQSSQQQQE